MEWVGEEGRKRGREKRGRERESKRARDRQAARHTHTQIDFGVSHWKDKDPIH